MKIQIGDFHKRLPTRGMLKSKLDFKPITAITKTSPNNLIEYYKSRIHK